VAWVAGAGEALPFADASLDLVVFAYSVHHFTEPRAPLGEIRRVLRPRGRLALVDLIIPGAAEAALSERHNAIERARDASHACTLFAAEVRQAAQSAGLRIVAEEQAERLRSFDDWMQIAGWQRGDAAYAETRRLMEASIAGDAAGFHARHAGDDLEFVQTSLFLKAEKREAR
jgi:SAM-dependent methyltransferase